MYIVDIMRQCITLKVQVENKEVWIPVVYAINDAADKRLLWAHFVDLNIRAVHGPWLMAEDFNVILKPEECSKFNQFQVMTTDMKDF